MPRAYAEDLRRRVVADTDKGVSMRAVAEKYAVSPSFVSKLTVCGGVRDLWRVARLVATNAMRWRSMPMRSGTNWPSRMV